MDAIACLRCKNVFYTAFTSKVKACPYCGYKFNGAEPSRRRQVRSDVDKDCVITRGGVTVVAKAVNISPDGVGVTAAEDVPFHETEGVHVVIEDLDIDSEATVVWTAAGSGGTGAMAGFLFTPATGGEDALLPSG